jgi:hypothetical protein
MLRGVHEAWWRKAKTGTPTPSPPRFALTGFLFAFQRAILPCGLSGFDGGLYDYAKLDHCSRCGSAHHYCRLFPSAAHRRDAGRHYATCDHRTTSRTSTGKLDWRPPRFARCFGGGAFSLTIACPPRFAAGSRMMFASLPSVISSAPCLVAICPVREESNVDPFQRNHSRRLDPGARGRLRNAVNPADRGRTL